MTCAYLTSRRLHTDNVYMKNKAIRQYTIRNVPQALDRVLRRKAQSEKRSLNEIALEALHRGAGVTGIDHPFTDLDALINSWEEDPDFERALSQQDVVEERPWR